MRAIEHQRNGETSNEKGHFKKPRTIIITVKMVKYTRGTYSEAQRAREPKHNREKQKKANLMVIQRTDVTLRTRSIRRYSTQLFHSLIKIEEDRGRAKTEWRRGGSSVTKKKRLGNYWQLALGCALNKRFMRQYVSARTMWHKHMSNDHFHQQRPPIVSSFWFLVSSDGSRRK